MTDALRVSARRHHYHHHRHYIQASTDYSTQ